MKRRVLAFGLVLVLIIAAQSFFVWANFNDGFGASITVQPVSATYQTGDSATALNAAIRVAEDEYTICLSVSWQWYISNGGPVGAPSTGNSTQYWPDTSSEGTRSYYALATVTWTGTELGQGSNARFVEEYRSGEAHITVTPRASSPNPTPTPTPTQTPTPGPTQTPAGNVPGTPNPRFQTSEDTIFVDWYHVGDNGGSPITSYYAQIGDDEPVAVIYTQHGVNNVYFRGLKPGTLYEIKVWAVNINGAGAPSVNNVRTFGYAPPDAVDPVTIVLTIDDPVYYINGERGVLDVAPRIVSDRTFVPVAFVATNLGADVTWEGETRTVVLVRGDDVLRFVIDSPSYTVNGAVKALDAPAFIDAAASRTLVPVSFVAQALGGKVSWEGSTRTVTITMGADD